MNTAERHSAIKGLQFVAITSVNKANPKCDKYFEWTKNSKIFHFSHSSTHWGEKGIQGDDVSGIDLPI